MKKLLSWLVFLLVLAGAGLAVLWVLQSDKIEKNIKAQIAQFNSGPMRLTYDALEMSGFPMRMYVNLVNPKLSGRMDAQFDPSKQRNLPEWKEEAALEGIVQFGIDAFSAHYELNVNGVWKNTSSINGQDISLASKAPLNAQCALQIERAQGWASTLWNFSSLEGRGKEFLKDFRLFDCSSADVTLIDPKTGVTLAQSGAQRIYISSDPQGDKRQIRFYVKGIDSLITPDGDKLFGIYSRALNPAVMPTMLSAYGKQNIEIDFTYIGPLDWKGDPRIAPVEVHLGRFVVTNDAYNVSATFDLTNTADAQTQSARVAFKSEATYNQIYGALAHETVRSVIAQLLTEQKIPPEMRGSHTPESLYALVSPAIPDFHALGKFTAALDLSFQGSPGLTAGDFTLSELELSVAPYGLTGKGVGKRSPGALMPAVSVVLNCRNCLQMIDDGTTYANRVQGIMSSLSPEKNIAPLDAATIAGYKGFLQAIAVDDGAGNFSYAIVNDGKLGISINKKPMNEILMLYHKYMPQPQR